jgi:hypothetical protein
MVTAEAGQPAVKTQDGVLVLFEQPFLTSPEVDQLARVEGRRNG